MSLSKLRPTASGGTQMFAGMAATGLPNGWGNALLVGRLDAADGRCLSS